MGESVDHRADLYAWGVVAYELLAGQHPFAGRIGTSQPIAAHIAETPTPLALCAPDIPRAVAALVMQCLEKDPAQRPENATALLTRLSNTVTPPTDVSAAPTRTQRARHDAYTNARLRDGDRFGQDLLRARLGADARLEHWLQVYAEVTTGQVHGRRRESGANFQNDVSLQQPFVNVRGHADGVLLGGVLGRQEFTDGPRQLLSVGDGPNLHRTWNGIWLYAHGRRVRIGGFDFRVTRPGRGAFDEAVDGSEKLRGVNASTIAHRGASATLYVDPFWIRSDQPAGRAGGVDGRDVRNTYGVRLWSRGRRPSAGVRCRSRRR